MNLILGEMDERNHGYYRHVYDADTMRIRCESWLKCGANQISRFAASNTYVVMWISWTYRMH